MRVEERREQAGIRCAYCHGLQDGAMDTCPACRTRLHVGCQRELGACSTLGCPRGQRPALAGEPEQPSLITTCASAALLGWAVAAIQELLLTRHTRTLSDVGAVTVYALLVTAALGIWLVGGERTRHARGRLGPGPTQAIALTAYLGSGLAGSSSAILHGVWLAAGVLLLAALGSRWLRRARVD